MHRPPEGKHTSSNQPTCAGGGEDEGTEQHVSLAAAFFNINQAVTDELCSPPVPRRATRQQLYHAATLLRANVLTDSFERCDTKHAASLSSSHSALEFNPFGGGDLEPEPRHHPHPSSAGSANTQFPFSTCRTPAVTSRLRRRR